MTMRCEKIGGIRRRRRLIPLQFLKVAVIPDTLVRTGPTERRNLFIDGLD